MKLTTNIGMLLLAVWLILTGLIPLLNFSFTGVGAVMAILAIASGVLIVVGPEPGPARGPRQAGVLRGGAGGVVGDLVRACLTGTPRRAPSCGGVDARLQ